MTTMRVTQNMLVDRSVGSLQTGLGRLAKVQEQLSTGRVLNRPSDSPTDTTSAMRMRSSISGENQYVRNAEDGLGWLGLIDQTLTSVTDQVRRARELALQGASSGTTSQSARDALATEIDGIRASLVAEGNTAYLGRPVFGGITSGDQAFDASGAFVGTPGAVNRTVADGVRVRVDVLGTDVFGPNGASLFDDLGALSTALRAGDTPAIRTGVSALAGRLDTIGSAQATVGSSYARLDRAAQKGRDAVLGLTSSLSEIENADLPRTMVELQMQEVAYQASLASTARVMQPSLVDFLR
jgi:flagellar hook-associated protein 3 FlgL